MFTIIPLDRGNECQMYVPMEHKPQIIRKEPQLPDVFVCNDGTTMNINLQNDLIPDCHQNAMDEEHLMHLKSYINYYMCKYSQEIPCLTGHSKCFNLSDVCIYKLNMFNYLIPCRNGGHMQNCKQFECNMMFKCLESHCIPWNYVCDGKWDCPRGDDEMENPVCNNKSRCLSMYKCRDTNTTCLHLGNVCDGNTDCLFGDDELLCDLNNAKCLINCHCLLFAISCNYLTAEDIGTLSLAHYQYVQISNSGIFSMKKIKHSLNQAAIITFAWKCLKRCL